MKVFIEYMVSVSALVEKEVPEGTDYHDVINSVTRDELVEADVQEVEWGHLKAAWRCEDHPNVYKAAAAGTVDWSEQMEN